jgi:hypothetical protein
MTVDSVTFDSSNYVATVNVSLPNDGYEHMIYLPASAQHSYPIIATTTDANGNPFDIVDVGTNSYATFNITMPADLSTPPAVNIAAFLYDNELYLAGNVAGYTLVNVTAVNLPKGVWYADGVTVRNNISVNTKAIFSTNVTMTLKKNPYFFVEPTSYVNVTLHKYSPSKVSFTSDAPHGESVTFVLKGLKPKTVYKLYVDDGAVRDLKSDANGVITFSWSSWSTHTFVIIPTNAAGEVVNWFVIVLAVVIIGGVFMGFADRMGIDLRDYDILKWAFALVGMLLALIIIRYIVL